MLQIQELSDDQRQGLEKYIKSYKEWLKTPEGQKDLKSHRNHQKFFGNKLSEDHIDEVDEDEFREIYKKLWASSIWGNKDWYIDNKLLKPNSLSKIKEELKKLLYSDEKISSRYDNFKDNVKGFGPSSISEILHFVSPDKFCLWNDKPKTVLPFLRLDILPERFFKYNIQNGEDYVDCINTLILIREELVSSDFKNPDFIDVDCFLWHIFNTIDFSKEVKKEAKPKKVALIKKISSHEEAEYYLLKLGELLEYLTYTADSSKSFSGKILGEIAILKDIPDFTGERDRSSARLIDIIWFDEVQNPQICIEVEHTTDITKGLNRLLQLSHFYVILVIVAPEDKRSKFEIEMNKSPFRKLKDRYRFISYEELMELYDNTIKFKETKDKLLG